MVKPLPADELAQVLNQTRDYWAEARGQSVFITGGTGFFGLWLLESFCHANDQLGLGARAAVLTRDPEAFARKAPHLATREDLEFVRGDVRTFQFPKGLFPYVIHAATEVSARDTLDVIVDGTRRVLDFVAQSGVKKLLLTSSGAVYGPQPAGLAAIPEEYVGTQNPLSPGFAYGEGKRVSEALCLTHARTHGYEVKIGRCFAFVGPHLPLDGSFAIGNFIRDALAGEAIRVAGDGTPVRSYLYAADLTVWLWTLLFRGPSERIYNVGSGDVISIAELAAVVAKTLGDRLPVVIAEQPGPVISRYIPDVSRAVHELGLPAKISLEDSIRRTAAWHALI